MTKQDNKKSEMVLGIDFGSGSVKIVLLDTQGRLLGQSQAAYPTITPQSGWAQQNPNDWVSAFQLAMQTLWDKTGVEPFRLCGVGICGAAHIPVLLDQNDQPTYPAILWSDCRSVKEVNYLENTFGEHIIRQTGNKPGCAWTLPQLLWLKNNHPNTLKQTTTFLTLKDYVVYLLTGRKVSDPGSASATLMYDIKQGVWSDELRALTGLGLSVFPEIVGSTRLVGKTNRNAKRFGFVLGTPVVSGCLDSVAEMLAVGAIHENDSVIRLGTAGALLTLRNEWQYTPSMLTYPFPFGNLVIKQAGTSSCGKSVDWVREVFAATPEELKRIANVPNGSEGLFFFPFLQGERTPYQNPELRGGFIGLSVRHRREHFLRAVLEGVCFSLRDCIESVQHHVKIPEYFHTIGGGTHNHYWLLILANILGVPIEAAKGNDSAGGAAILALENIGCLHRNQKNNINTVSPNIESIREYNKLFERYQEIAEKLNRLYAPKA
jgi:xylulokinase